jgi:hypothetical protein
MRFPSCQAPLRYEATFETAMIMLLAILRRLLTYILPALVEIAPTKLIAKTCLSWEKHKCYLSSHALRGLL